MGLTSQLTVLLLFGLLPCTANLAVTARYNALHLQEILKTLTVLLERKTPCTQLTVEDIFSGPQNTSMENLCRATTVLRQVYINSSEVAQCLTQHKEHDSLNQLKRIYRAIYRAAPRKFCPVNDSRKSTWEDFLEKLKRMMQEKYYQCGSMIF